MTNNLIIASSRYGEPRYLEKKDENTYYIWGGSNDDLMWVGFTDENQYNSIDYSGGPNITINNPNALSDFNLNDLIVKSITRVEMENKANCYELIVEKM